MVDLFIAHAWRFHPEWVQLSDVIENQFLDSVRNFSLPWHDPAISSNSEYGRDFLENQLKSQILPAQYVLLIDDLFKVESNLRWLFACIDFGLSEKKHIVLINGSVNISKYRPAICDTNDNFELIEFANWIKNLLRR